MFKVQFDPKQVEQLEVHIKKNFEQVLSTPELMTEVGEFVVERLKYQARTGKPLTAAGSFPALATSTVQNRKYLAKQNETQATYKDSRSNVTLTGAFLDSMTYELTGEPGGIRILFDGKHPGYKTGSGQTAGPLNADLAGYLSDKGFKVFDKSVEDNKTIVQRVRAIGLKYLRRGLRI